MLEPITAGLFRLYTPFFGIPLNLYVIGGKQVVLIDSGIATTPEEFVIPALEAAQLTPELLICTHQVEDGSRSHGAPSLVARQR